MMNDIKKGERVIRGVLSYSRYCFFGRDGYYLVG